MSEEAITAATNQRDYHGEANAIKQELTKIDSDVKLKMSSLIEIVYDGLSLFKTDRANLTHYTPDFFVCGELIVRIYNAFRNTRELKRNEDFDPFGFLLYCFYGMWYIMIKTYNENNVSDFRYREIQTAFENCGFNTARLPMLLNKWCDAIGRYTDPGFGRIFDVFLPEIAQEGPYFENFFFSSQTAHLLPNFRLIIMKAFWFCTTQIDGVLAGQRNANLFRAGVQYNNVLWFNNTALARANEAKSPGIGFIRVRQVAPELAEICQQTINMQFNNVYQRYLQFNPRLMRYLNEYYTPIVKMMDNFEISKISPIGTDLLICPIIESDYQETLDPERPANLEANQQRIPAQFNYVFRVSTRKQITNGNALVASVTPVVRIATYDNKIEIGDMPNLFEINDVWYVDYIEYDTINITLEEAHAQFGPK